jgi:hypothetical protein
MARFASLVVSKWPVALGVLVAGSLAVFLLLLNGGGRRLRAAFRGAIGRDPE